MKWHKKFLLAVSLFSILTNLAIYSAKASEYNRCLQFDGTNYAEASRNIIPTNGDFTVELMVFSNSKNQGKYAHYISQGNQPQPFYIGTDPNSKVRLGDQWINSNYTLQHNRWVHLAVTHSANNYGRLYANGNLVATANGTYDTSKSGTVTRFGSQFFGNGGEFFSGCLDNIRIWKSVRDQKQIQDNWKLSTPLDSTNLVANYHFDNYYGYLDKLREVQSEDRNSSNILIYRNSPLSVPETGSFNSTHIVSSCYGDSRWTNNYVPNIEQVVARDKFTTLLQINSSQVPKGACVGVDLFIRGSNIPISSTVALKTNEQDLLYIDTANFACHADKSNQLIARPWSKLGNDSSVYGNSIDIPGCAGKIPSVSSEAMSENQTASLISNGSTLVFGNVLDRIKNSNLQLPNNQINGTNQKIYESFGCHAKVSIALIQRASNGNWVDAQPAEGWDLKNFCDAAHPYQPYVNINYPDGTVLRWKVSDGYNWEVFSAPFVFKSNFTTVQPQPTSSATSNSSSTPTQTNLLAVPFAFSPRISGNNVIINVSFNKVVEKDAKLIFVSDALGYGKEKPLVGTLSGNKGSFVLPKSKFANLKSDPVVRMQTKGSAGNSPELSGKIPLNSLKLGAAKPETKKVTKPVAAPKETIETPDTVVCSKGNLIRTFISKSCPPGWNLKG